MVYFNEDGTRNYTLKASEWAHTTSHTKLACVYQKETPEGNATQSAHPGTSPELVAPLLTSLSAARFSPDDSFSRQRVQLKKRFNLLPTQQENIEY